jgi:DNA polymerase-3 subunit beta
MFVERLLGIGALAAASGLSVSALRFYDGAGLLVPAVVESHNGYRRYHRDQVAQARLIARLRRVSMPLADISQVLQRPESAQQVLTVHLQRLEAGLADARRELATISDILNRQETQMQVTLSAAEFARALRAVRFAVSSNPELPMLNGVLLDIDGDASTVSVVASDRYRLAVDTVVATCDGTSKQVLLPISLVSEALDALDSAAAEQAVIAIDGNQVSISCGSSTAKAVALDFEFPDYRRLLPATPRPQVPVDAVALRQAMLTGTTRTMQRGELSYDVSVLSVAPTGELAVAPDGVEGSVGVNREFLLQALAAGDSAQLLLELDGPIGPLAIRHPERAGSFSLLMPTRLD